MEKIKEKEGMNKNDNKKYLIIAKKKCGKKQRGKERYRTEQDAHRHWANLCKFVPMQMNKYISYVVEKE